MKKKFEHPIGAHVELALSKEKGCVIARAKYDSGVRQYLVRYLAANGQQVEAWFGSDALRNVNAARSIGDLLTEAVIGGAKVSAVPLPHPRINDAAIESVKLKAEPYVAKPNGEELEAIKSHLDSLSLNVAALQSEVSGLGGQFTVLADRFSVSAQ